MKHIKRIATESICTLRDRPKQVRCSSLEG